MTLQSGPTESSITKTKCLVCGSRATRPSDGFIVCTECGTCQDRELVQGVYIFREGSYEGAAQYTDIGNKMHVANAKGSQIGFSRRQPIFRTSKILRLKRVHHQTTMQIEKRLSRGLIWINKVAERLQLPTQTRDRAAYLLRKTLPHYSIYRIQNPLVVCVLVLAIREHRLPLKEDDVLEIIPLLAKNKNQLNRAKFFVMEHMGISWPTHRPECFIPIVISALRKNPKVLERLELRNGTPDYFNRLERLSTRLLQSMNSIDYGGRYPNNLAASAVYSIDRLILNITTQKTCGEAVGVAEYSVRDHYQNLWKRRLTQIKELLEEAE